MWSFRSSLAPSRSNINHLLIYTRGMSEVLHARGMCEGTSAQSPCSAVRAASTARRCCGRHGISDPHLKYTRWTCSTHRRRLVNAAPELRLIHLRHSYQTQQSATCVKLGCDFVLRIRFVSICVGEFNSTQFNLRIPISPSETQDNATGRGYVTS